MTYRRALVLGLCGLLGLLMAAPSAEGRARSRRKAPRETPEEAAKSLQRKLFKEAQQHFVAGRYVEAAETFKKAFEARPHRSIQVNIAMSYASMGDNLKAYDHLQIYMKMRAPSDPPLPEVLQQLPLRIGSIVVRVPDPKVGIFVDGQIRGNTEVKLLFEPSKRVVDVRLGNRIVATRVIDVKGGQEHIWEVTQQMLEAAKPRPVEPTPPRREVVFVPTPGPTPTDDSGKKKLGRLHWAYFTAAAVLVAAAAGAAAYTSFKNLQIHDDFVKDPTNRDLQQEGILYQNTANGLWGATAAVAVTAAVLGVFTRWKPKARERQVTVAPLSGPGSLGLSLTISQE